MGQQRVNKDTVYEYISLTYISFRVWHFKFKLVSSPQFKSEDKQPSNVKGSTDRQYKNHLGYVGHNITLRTFKLNL